MPYKSHSDKIRCKYCDKGAKINRAKNGHHKGYCRTCGDERCLKKQYEDVLVNKSKKYIKKGVKEKCFHCKKEFIKAGVKQKYCKECCPDRSASAIMRRYGLSRKEYLKMIEDVSAKCPICEIRKASVVDHCHQTGGVRGIICNHCNMALNIIENEEILKRATNYLFNYKNK